MRLLFWRRGPSKATLERIQAEKDLERAKAATPAYRELAQSLIEVQRRNHLGASIADIFRGEQ